MYAHTVHYINNTMCIVLSVIALLVFGLYSLYNVNSISKLLLCVPMLGRFYFTMGLARQR